MPSETHQRTTFEASECRRSRFLLAWHEAARIENRGVRASRIGVCVDNVGWDQHRRIFDQQVPIIEHGVFKDGPPLREIAGEAENFLPDGSQKWASVTDLG